MRRGVAPVRWWAHPHLRHLRLHFNVLLSPIYLWGLVLARADPGSARVWVGYVAVHLFLYGGATAFNSYYDRDEGPVGGLLHPPAVDAALLPFSLVVQALGLPLALAVSRPFAGAWLVLFAVFTAYSHPWVRLKARPVAALAAIALGQGAVGFALGWLAGRAGSGAGIGLLGPASLTGMATAALVVVGLYVVTQSYQTAEDRARGDRTLPVILGPRTALRLAVALLAPGGVLMLLTLAGRAPWPLTTVVALFFAAVAAWVLRWAARFREAQVERNFRVAMRVAGVSSGGLALVLLALLIAP